MKTKDFYCDAHHYSGHDKCQKQCDACKQMPKQSIELAKNVGVLKQNKQDLKELVSVFR